MTSLSLQLQWNEITCALLSIRALHHVSDGLKVVVANALVEFLWRNRIGELPVDLVFLVVDVMREKNQSMRSITFLFPIFLLLFLLDQKSLFALLEELLLLLCEPALELFLQLLKHLRVFCTASLRQSFFAFPQLLLDLLGVIIRSLDSWPQLGHLLCHLSSHSRSLVFFNDDHRCLLVYLRKDLHLLHPVVAVWVVRLDDDIIHFKKLQVLSLIERIRLLLRFLEN